MKKQIDFETLCRNCNKRLCRLPCQCLSNWAEKETCPIWNSLPDVPKTDKRKDKERQQKKLCPSWLEYEGY